MRTKLYAIIAATALAAPAFGENIVLTADSCRTLAVANNESLRKASNNTRRAELDKEIAFTAYLPDFSATAAAMYMVEDADMMGTKLSMKGTYLAGVSLTQPLYAGGRIRQTIPASIIAGQCFAIRETIVIPIEMPSTSWSDITQSLVNNAFDTSHFGPGVNPKMSII